MRPRVKRQAVPLRFQVRHSKLLAAASVGGSFFLISHIDPHTPLEHSGTTSSQQASGFELCRSERVVELCVSMHSNVEKHPLEKSQCWNSARMALQAYFGQDNCVDFRLALSGRCGDHTEGQHNREPRYRFGLFLSHRLIWLLFCRRVCAEAG